MMCKRSYSRTKRDGRCRTATQKCRALLSDLHERCEAISAAFCACCESICQDCYQHWAPVGTSLIEQSLKALARSDCVLWCGFRQECEGHVQHISKLAHVLLASSHVCLTRGFLLQAVVSLLCWLVAACTSADSFQVDGILLMEWSLQSSLLGLLAHHPLHRTLNSCQAVVSIFFSTCSNLVSMRLFRLLAAGS